MKKILVNGHGQSYEAKSIYLKNKFDESFVYKNIFAKPRILSILQEKKVHKINALKSRKSKIEYKYWNRNVCVALLKFAKSKNNVNYIALKKQLISISTDNGNPIIIYHDKFFKEHYESYALQCKDIIDEISSNSNALSFLKSFNTKSLTEQEMKDNSFKIRSLTSILKNELESLTQKHKEILNFIREYKTVERTAKTVDRENIKKVTKITKQCERKAFIEALKSFKKSFKKHWLINKDLPLKEKLNFSVFLKAFKLEKAKHMVVKFEEIKALTWDLEYKRRIYQVQSKFISDYFLTRHNEAKKIQEIKAHFKSNLIMFFLSNFFIEKKVKDKIKILKKEFSTKKTEQKQIYNDASRKARSVIFKNLANEKKTQIHLLKLESSLFKNKNELRTANAQANQAITLKNKLLISNLQETRKQTPVEITKRKYWLSIFLGSLIPGFSGLINKQYAKSFLQLFATFLISLMLAWTFGAFPSTLGNGVIGLSTLGAENGQLANNGANDSRFFLVMGAVSIIFLLIAVIYWILSALNNINVNNLAKLGTRYTNWKNQKEMLKTGGLPYLLSAPAIIFIIFIVVLPLFATIMIAFTNIGQNVWDPVAQSTVTLDGIATPFNWVGLDQFEYIGRVAGADFTNVLGWTIAWTFFSTILTIFLGALFAILVNQNRIKGKTFFRIIYILPWAIPAFVTIMFFSLFFQHDGVFNTVIGKSLFGKEIDWIGDGNYTKALLVFLQAWLGQSYMFLLITGMLQSIPKSLYEAARVDGASQWKQFKTITVPIITSQIMPLLIGQFVFNFNNFGMIYLFNGGGIPGTGETAGQFDIFISWIYRLVNGATGTRPGAAAAMTLIVSIFVVTPSAIIFFRSKSYRGESR